MKTLAQFSLKDGTAILIETESTTKGGEVVRAAKASQLLEKSQGYLEDILAKVEPVANAISAILSKTLTGPDEAEVEFGLKVGVGANAIISATSLEGNFRISMKWKRSKQS